MSKVILLNKRPTGKLTYTETIVNGFDNIPQAFIDLFDGANEGKMICLINAVYVTILLCTHIMFALPKI